MKKNECVSHIRGSGVYKIINVIKNPQKRVQKSATVGRRREARGTRPSGGCLDSRRRWDPLELIFVYGDILLNSASHF